MRSRYFAIIAIAASLLCAALAAPASATVTLNATWVVTYYLDPTGAEAGTECINFFGPKTQNGVTTGSWNSPTFPGWTGQWVQRGQHYAWHGFYKKNGAHVATYDVGDFVNANITAETSVGKLADGGNGPMTVSTGTATMMQVPSCTGIAPHRGNEPMVGF